METPREAASQGTGITRKGYLDGTNQRDEIRSQESLEPPGLVREFKIESRWLTRQLMSTGMLN
jgi:hypothetical protein